MGYVILGIILAIVGIAGFFFIGRRQFHRRNVAGVEEFSGYGSMLGSRLFEGSVRLIAAFLFIAGAILALVGYYQM